jgi:signal recognition particle receptor subunit beta
MMSTQELKIVFTGPMGAGKTTAIAAISDAPPVSTEVGNHDQQSFAKASTTVALDYGEVEPENGASVRLYGTPGQGRFSFMWEIIGRGALGVILLLDASSGTALNDLTSFVETFRRTTPDQAFVVGVGRLPEEYGARLEEFSLALLATGVVAPVFAVDVRVREDVLLLIETLLCILETRIPESDNAVA